MRARASCSQSYPRDATPILGVCGNYAQPRPRSRSTSPRGPTEATMQHGQILELKTTGPGGQRLWAYRYRLDGRGSPRIQRGGYLTADEAHEALQQALTAAQRRKGRVRVTLPTSSRNTRPTRRR